MLIGREIDKDTHTHTKSFVIYLKFKGTVPDTATQRTTSNGTTGTTLRDV